MKHLLKKIREVGIVNCIVGFLKREKYKKMQRTYHFDNWHISPYELRKYLQATVDYINSKDAQVVVDIGCGLGEMLRRIKAADRVGMDVHEETIRAAEQLSKGDITYCVGSFQELQMEKPIDYLVSLGFMHGGTEEAWRMSYRDAAKRNHILHFVVDTVPEEGGSHYLNFSDILPDYYHLVDKMGPFLGDRYIEVYELDKESTLEAEVG